MLLEVFKVSSTKGVEHPQGYASRVFTFCLEGPYGISVHSPSRPMTLPFDVFAVMF